MKKAICFSLWVTMIVLIFSLTQNGVEFVYSYGYLIPMDLSYKVITPDSVKVMSVVDGDTLKVSIVSGGISVTESVRLIGVDTPETVHPTKAVQEYGIEASDFLKKLCKEGQEAYLTYDWNQRDIYRRLLAYVWIKNDAGGWVLVNLVIVENGYGHAYLEYSFRKDYMVMFTEAQKKAQDKAVGLWAGASVSTKVEQTPVTPPGKTTTYQYIGNKNSKVFHRLSCKSLPAMQNRVYFYTREEAIAAGYRPCGNCKP